MHYARPYQWILFDADETLFHFDAFSGLQRMFAKYNVNFTKNYYEEYQKTNIPLWAAYQKGTISAEELKYKRFDLWASRLCKSTQELNNSFINTMAELSTPLEGARSLVRALKRADIKLGIITNGFAALQVLRLERTGFRDFFDIVVISEEVGIAKPNKGIFDHALLRMGNPKSEDVLMVGDSLESDILGGINAGLHTCWLNASNKADHESILPSFKISSLKELEERLGYNENSPYITRAMRPA